MYKVFLFFFILSTSLNLYSQSSDTVYFQENNYPLSYYFSVSDIKTALKNRSDLTPESLLNFYRMIDSVSATGSKQIKEDDILKFRKETTDFIIFYKAIYSLIKGKKVEFMIENSLISRTNLKIKRRFITCCNSLPRIFNNTGCCSERHVFYYKNEIVGTLYLKWFPRMINCF